MGGDKGRAQAFKELTTQRAFVSLEDNTDSSIYRSVLLDHHDLDSQRILWEREFLKSKKKKNVNTRPQAFQYPRADRAHFWISSLFTQL